MADDVRRDDPDMPSLPEKMNQLWRSLTGLPFSGLSREGLWHPTVNVYDRDEEIVVEVELPGMKGEEVNVSLEEDHLFIKGSRPDPAGYEEGQSYYVERPSGDFHRIIHLPCSVDEEATAARYDDGILTVTLPKAARERARKIEIK
jgi:HSP20 family protein